MKNKIYSILILLFIFIMFSACFLSPEDKHESENPVPKNYTIIYHSDFGTTPEPKIVPENYILVEEDLPELAYFRQNFNGWSDERNHFITAGYVVKNNLTLKAKWVEESKVKYKVYHYLQNLVDNDYSYGNSETFYDYADELTRAEFINYPGFNVLDYEQEKIKADGSTVINIYYERKSYTLSFDTDGGSPINSVIVKYGQEIDEMAFITSKEGYTFSGWEPQIDNYLKADQISKAIWSPCLTKYTLNRYFENIDDDEYHLDESFEQSGLTGQYTNEKPIDFIRFELQPFDQQIIKADGSTTINIYYKRARCVANFYDNDGNLITTVTGKYNQPFPEIPVAEIDFFTFDGWKREETTFRDTEFYFDNANYYPIYKPYEKVRYTTNHYYQNIDDDSYPETPSRIDMDFEQYGRETKSLSNTPNGFKSLPFEQQVIKKDGSTVVNIYYERKTYKVIFLGRSEEIICEVEGKYEAKVPKVSDPTEENYKFLRWENYPELFKFYDIKVNSEWADLRRDYVITHIFEFLNDENFIFLNNMDYSSPEQFEEWKIMFSYSPWTNRETDGKWGILGEMTEIEPRLRTNYEVLPFEQRIITDNSEDREITLYYVLKKYTYTFDTDGGSLIVPRTLKYGSRILSISEPKKEGYIFIGWENEGKIISEFPKTMDKDRTYKAIWQKKSI